MPRIAVGGLNTFILLFLNDCGVVAGDGAAATTLSGVGCNGQLGVACS